MSIFEVDFHIMPFILVHFKITNYSSLVSNNQVFTIRCPFHASRFSSIFLCSGERFIVDADLFFCIVIPQSEVTLNSSDCKIRFLRMNSDTFDLKNNWFDHNLSTFVRFNNLIKEASSSLNDHSLHVWNKESRTLKRRFCILYSNLLITFIITILAFLRRSVGERNAHNG